MSCLRKIIFLVMPLLALSCSTSGVAPSAGDSPVHRIKCPSFSAWKMCVARAEKKHCQSATSRLLSPSVEELDSNRADGQTVSIEGAITYRIITIICED